MSTEDELHALHQPLVEDARQYPDYHDNAVSAIYGYSEGVEHALVTVWNKGYRKPRTITTVEELDALAEESVVRSADGYVYESQHLVDAPYPVEWHPCGVAESYKSHVIELPATVLWEPLP